MESPLCLRSKISNTHDYRERLCCGSVATQAMRRGWTRMLSIAAEACWHHKAQTILTSFAIVMLGTECSVLSGLYVYSYASSVAIASFILYFYQPVVIQIDEDLNLIRNIIAIFQSTINRSSELAKVVLSTGKTAIMHIMCSIQCLRLLCLQIP